MGQKYKELATKKFAPAHRLTHTLYVVYFVQILYSFIYPPISRDFMYTLLHPHIKNEFIKSVRITRVMKGTEVPIPRRSSACDSGMRMLRQPGRVR